MSNIFTQIGQAVKAKLDLKANASDLANKVDKVAGKGLSTEDYTTEEKTKLSSLSNYALPVANETTLGGVKAGTNISIDANGVISANDTSVAWTEVTGKPTFATVATSGSYADLTNKPTVISLGSTAALANGTAAAGTATTAAHSDHVHPLQTTVSGNAGTATKLQTARLISGVSFDGSANITIPYSGLSGLPTIPTVPTAVSAFTNDSGYQTSAQVNTAIQAIVGAAPAALDTLAEIATQLQNDESAVASLVSTVSAKANSSDVYTKTEVDAVYGNISSLLATINGEVI